MVRNANTAPQLEELPVSDKAAELIHAINGVHYVSQLRKIGRRDLVGLSPTEIDIVQSEKSARRKMLLVSPGVPPDVTPEPMPLPEAASSAPTETPWSPTDVLKTMPEVELGPQDFAAGAAVKRPHEE